MYKLLSGVTLKVLVFAASHFCRNNIIKPYFWLWRLLRDVREDEFSKILFQSTTSWTYYLERSCHSNENLFPFHINSIFSI